MLSNPATGLSTFMLLFYIFKGSAKPKQMHNGTATMIVLFYWCKTYITRVSYNVL